MEPRHLTLAALQLTTAAAALCAMLGSALAASASMRDVEDSNALVMTAEIALQRDDCGRAAANYTVAAQRLADAKLAERATGVALDCGQFQAAERAAARWRQLTPTAPAALRAAMRADLGLYKIDDARSAFEGWISNGGGLAPAKRGQRGHEADGSDNNGAKGNSAAGAAAADDNIAEQMSKVALESGVPATLAMVRGTQVARLQSGRAQLALGDLAFDGWNYREALQYGQRALTAGAERAPTQLLLARAHAGLGEADLAVAAAGAARSAAPKEQSFAAADVLILLGRERDARMALESRRDPGARRPQAERRLGLLAFERGDYVEAQNVFSALLKDPESSGIAVYYLAAIAERRGGGARALRCCRPRTMPRRQRGWRRKSRRRSCWPTAAKATRRWRASTMCWRAFRATRTCSTRRRCCWRRPAAPTPRSRSSRPCIAIARRTARSATRWDSF